MTDKVADIQVAKNKRKDKEGRLKNLAMMFVNREVENGPLFAGMWLYREFHEKKVDNFEEEWKKLFPYIEAERKKRGYNGGPDDVA